MGAANLIAASFGNCSIIEAGLEVLCVANGLGYFKIDHFNPEMVIAIGFRVRPKRESQ